VQVFTLFDVKQKGLIDFGDFVRSLNVFHPNAAQDDKIDCESLIFFVFLFVFFWVVGGF
jgi:Ca2+-binding EF-hand superfamily protein